MRKLEPMKGSQRPKKPTIQGELVQFKPLLFTVQSVYKEYCQLKIEFLLDMLEYNRILSLYIYLFLGAVIVLSQA